MPHAVRVHYELPMTYRETPLPAPVVVAGCISLDAFDRRTGAPAWNQKTSSAIRRMIVTEDRVVVLCSNGNVECFDLASGTPLGVVKTDLKQGYAMIQDQSMLLIVGDRGVLAMDLSGRVLWSRPLPASHYAGLRGVGIPGLVCQPDYDT